MGHPPRFVTVGRVRVRAPPPLGTHRGGGGVSPLRVGCRPPPPEWGPSVGAPRPFPWGWDGEGTVGRGHAWKESPGEAGGGGSGQGARGGESASYRLFSRSRCRCRCGCRYRQRRAPARRPAATCAGERGRAGGTGTEGGARGAVPDRFPALPGGPRPLVSPAPATHPDACVPRFFWRGGMSGSSVS